MDITSKVNTLLDAWLHFVKAEDLSGIENPEKRRSDGVELLENRLLLNESLFNELQKTLQLIGNKRSDVIWALSFPQIYQEKSNKLVFHPLFSLDITPIFQGRFQAQGWEIEQFRFIEAGKTLTTLLKMEDEQIDQLIIKEGLRSFLKHTFNTNVETFEAWLQQIALPGCLEVEQWVARSNRSTFGIRRQPYLFEFTGGPFTFKLKQDLREIRDSQNRRWQQPKHPAYEFLFGIPDKTASREVSYLGAFPTPDPPTYSQLDALKYSQSEPITAVQGPPGSGKTTLILHGIAQQVVKRAITLIETGQDINNLTVISSTNNRAVDNVIERIDEDFPIDFFYLRGGKKDVINGVGGAAERLQAAISFLQSANFDEDQYQLLIRDIQLLKRELVNHEQDYLNQRQLREMETNLQAKLQQSIQEQKQKLVRLQQAQTQYTQRSIELSIYREVPETLYQKLQQDFEEAQQSLPEPNAPWFKQIWFWLTWRTEKQILSRLRQRCQPTISQIQSHQFTLTCPNDRNSLMRQSQKIQTNLARLQDLRYALTQLVQLSSQENEVIQVLANDDKRLEGLNQKLAEPLEDFYCNFHTDYHEQHQKIFRLSQQFLIQKALQQKADVIIALTLYADVLSPDRNTSWQAVKRLTQSQQALVEQIQYLSLIFPVITFGLYSLKNMIPWLDECVDRCIIDEAGMIPLHQAFPLLVRSRRAIIVGDPLQIEPVITQSSETLELYFEQAFTTRGLSQLDYNCYSPAAIESATTYHRAAGASGEIGNLGYGIRLREHYRCQPRIIEFCNRIAGYGLEAKTKQIDSLLGSNLIAYHVEGSITDGVNREEIAAIHEVVQHLIEHGYLPKEIGIVSPFHAQAEAIKNLPIRGKSLLEKYPVMKDSIGTVHKFQGSERRVMILSTRVCRRQDNIAWINRRPNLLNVAVSRAKELLILIGNLYHLDRGQYTRQLVEHIQNEGVVLEFKSEDAIPSEAASAPENAVIHNCDHLEVLGRALREAEQEIFVVAPLVRGMAAEQFIRDVVPVLQRGVKVTVIHANFDDANPQAEIQESKAAQKLKELFAKYPGASLIPLQRETNERILVCDRRFAVVGSWNWLSHMYSKKSCADLQSNPSVQLRRETSVLFSGAEALKSVQEKIAQVIQKLL